MLVLNAEAEQLRAGESIYLGSVDDYLSTNAEFGDAYQFPALGIQARNGSGTLENRYEFDGVEVVGVRSGSPGALAGLKGQQRGLQTMMIIGVIAASLFFPPAMMGLAALDSSRTGESHELIIAVDGMRTRDLSEFGDALKDARPGEIVYLTVVRDGRRKQVQLTLSK